MNTSIIRKIKLSILMVMVIVMFLPLTMFADGEEVTVGSSTELCNQMNNGNVSKITLSADINISGDTRLTSYVNGDKTLDLNGYSITFDTGNTNATKIIFHYNSNSNIQIINSNGEKRSAIKTTSAKTNSTYYPARLLLKNSNLSAYSASITIDGVDLESFDENSYVIDKDNSKLKNLTIKNSTISGFGRIFDAGVSEEINLQNITIAQNSKSYISNSSSLTVNDIFGKDSIIKCVNSSGETVNVDGTTTLDKITAQYGPITIKDADLVVDDITFDDLTYGYSSTTSKPISIKNKSGSALAIKKVESSNDNFIVESPTTAPSIAVGGTDTSYSIKVKEGLNAKTDSYTAKIMVTDVNDEIYIATVSVKVNPITITGHSISLDDWTYGDTAKTETITGLDGLSSSDYEITYATQGSTTFNSTKPSVAGNYTVKLSITNENYSAENKTDDFTINQNSKEIKIVANSNSWTYDGSDHSDSGYKVYYDNTEVTNCSEGTCTLSTGDTISNVVISGSVKDVSDTAVGNNVVTSYELTNKDSYSNKKTENGNLKITSITTQITVTAKSANKIYDGTALTVNNYEYTQNVLLKGDTLTATVTGSQTYVGSSSNVVSEVKVTRGDKDITSNYTFDNNVNGTLTVNPSSQNLTIDNQSVIITNSITLEKLKASVSGNQGELSFSIESGNNLITWDGTNNKYTAGSNTGIVTMTVTAAAKDANNDGTAEYSGTSKDFNIEIKPKNDAGLSGTITGGTEFDYDGYIHAPNVKISATNQDVNVDNDIVVSYTGTKTDNTQYSSETAPSDAGTYTVTYKVRDDHSTCTGSVSYNFTIKKAQLTKPNLETSQQSFVYTGQEIEPNISDFDSALENATGDTKYQNVGDYTITISLKNTNNYEWSDGKTENVVLTWKITKAKVTIPTLANNTFIYTAEGNGYKPTINNENLDFINYSGDIGYKKNVDNYSIKAELKDASNYMWDDNSSSFKILNWSITKAPVTKPTLAQISYEYSGSDITPAFNGFDDTLMQKTNDVNKINVGNYSITIGLIDSNNYAWTDGTTAEFTISWSITKKEITKPTLGESEFEYTGQEITLPTLSNYDEDIMSIVSDSNKGTNVGDYSVQISLDDVDNYEWSEGGSNTLSFDWHIISATSRIIEAESTSIYYKNNGGTATIKASGVMKDFVKLMIYKNDTVGYEEVDASNYTVSSGSTIIVLKESYLQTLDYDKDYKFMLVYNNNYTEAYPVHILKVRKYVAPSSNNSDSTGTVAKKAVNTSSH